MPPRLFYSSWEKITIQSQPSLEIPGCVVRGSPMGNLNFNRGKKERHTEGWSYKCKLAARKAWDSGCVCHNIWHGRNIAIYRFTITDFEVHSNTNTSIVCGCSLWSCLIVPGCINRHIFCLSRILHIQAVVLHCVLNTKNGKFLLKKNNNNKTK